MTELLKLIRILWKRVTLWIKGPDETARCFRCLDTYYDSLDGLFNHAVECRPDADIIDAALELDEETPEMPRLVTWAGTRSRVKVVSEGPPVRSLAEILQDPPKLQLLPPPDLHLFQTISK